MLDDTSASLQPGRYGSFWLLQSKYWSIGLLIHASVTLECRLKWRAAARVWRSRSHPLTDALYRICSLTSLRIFEVRQSTHRQFTGMTLCLNLFYVFHFRPFFALSSSHCTVPLSVKDVPSKINPIRMTSVLRRSTYYITQNGHFWHLLSPPYMTLNNSIADPSSKII